MPNNLPGYQSVNDPEVRSRFEAGWNVRLPSTKGLDNHEMIDAIHQGKLKAMYVLVKRLALSFQLDFVWRRTLKAGVFRGAGYFL